MGAEPLTLESMTTEWRGWRARQDALTWAWRGFEEIRSELTCVDPDPDTRLTCIDPERERSADEWCGSCSIAVGALYYEWGSRAALDAEPPAAPSRADERSEEGPDGD